MAENVNETTEQPDGDAPFAFLVETIARERRGAVDTAGGNG